MIGLGTQKTNTMTRINCGIPPENLTDKHLLAEHREIKRIPNLVKSGRYSMKGQPKKFTLGTGHVKFFYDKLGYLANRYLDIHIECLSRGFHVSWFGDAWKGVPAHMMGDYSPTWQDSEIVYQRIKEKLSKSSTN